MKKAIQILSLSVGGEQQASNSTTTEASNATTAIVDNNADFKHVVNMAIERIARIPGNKTQSGKAVIVVYPVNSKFGINRSEEQFLYDLKNSFLISNDVTSVMDDEVSELLAEFQSGDFTINGRIANYAKGSKYKLDEYSREVKDNPSLLGQERERTLDTGLVLRGTFLTFKKTSEAKLQSKIANSTGKQMARLFAGFVPTHASNNGGGDNGMQQQPEQQPEQKEAEGAGAAPVVQPATTEGVAEGAPAAVAVVQQ